MSNCSLLIFKSLVLLLGTPCLANQPVQGCSPYEFEVMENSPIRIASRKRIGVTKQWNGVRPVHYNIELDFFKPDDFWSYQGDVSLDFITTKRIRSFLFNYNYKFLGNASLLNITVTKNSEAKALCIRKVRFITQEKLVIVTFERSLMGKSEYNVKIQNFLTRAFGNYRYGLLVDWEHGLSGTILQTENARNVFPCLDHPALKAQFSLCIMHQSNLHVASNTKIYHQKHMDRKGEIVRTCFKKTPIMSTYLVTFSLMDSPNIQKSRDQFPEIIIYSSGNYLNPAHDNDNNIMMTKTHHDNIMITHSRKIIKKMENITNIKFPLDKLGIVKIPKMPAGNSRAWGIENFGLINLKHDNEEINKWTLALNIVHHWIGNLATVSYWGEVCLQKTLADLLASLLSNNIRLIYFFVGKYPFSYQYAKVGPNIQNRNDIDINCFGMRETLYALVAPFVMSRNPFSETTKLSEADEMFFKFINILINRYKFSSFSYLEFVQAMDEAFDSPEPSRMLDSYFLKREVPILYVLKNETDKSILVHYKVLVGGNTVRSLKKYVETPLALPLTFFFRVNETVLYYDDNYKRIIESEETVYRISNKTDGNNISWYMLDPYACLLAVRIYDVRNYLELANFVLSFVDQCSISDHYTCFIDKEMTVFSLDETIFQFCTYLEKNLDYYPFPNDPATQNEVNATKTAMLNLFNSVLYVNEAWTTTCRYSINRIGLKVDLSHESAFWGF